MIEIDDVTRQYGEVAALDGVSMTVDEGAAVGLVGTNGAGKTTLFRLLVGHATPDEGTVRVADASPTAGAELRERVGFVPEDASFDPRLTAREVLALHARLRGVPDDERAERVARVLATVGLEAAADRRVDGYSNGMTQRLAIGTALVRRPDVLLLDEPTAALDPQGVDAFNAVVDRVRERTSVTLVVTSHVLSEVERLCDRVVVMHEGEVRARGSVEEVTAIAGEDATLTLRPADASAVAVLADELPDAVDAATCDVGAADVTVAVRGDAVVATTSREAAFDVLATARDVTALEGFEVSEPGLEDAFDVAIDDSRVEDTADDATTDGGQSTDDATTDGGQSTDDATADGGQSTDDATAESAQSTDDATAESAQSTDDAVADGGVADAGSSGVAARVSAAGSSDEPVPDGAVADANEAETEAATPALSASVRDAIATIAHREYRIATRSRWPVGLTVLFAAFTAGVVQYGASGVGASTVPSVVASIAALATYVVPLAALAFGYATVVGPRERGELDVLYALPVPRWSIVVGAFVGRAFAFAGAVVVGFGAGGALLFRVGGVPAVQAYLPTVVAAVLVGVSFLGLAVLVSTVASEKAHALGAALIAWAWFVLVHDVVALTAVVAFDLPAWALAVLVVANPADCLRVLGTVGVPMATGGAGALGATQLSVPLVVAVLLAWIVLPVAAAARFAGRSR